MRPSIISLDGHRFAPWDPSKAHILVSTLFNNIHTTNHKIHACTIAFITVATGGIFAPDFSARVELTGNSGHCDVLRAVANDI